VLTRLQLGGGKRGWKLLILKVHFLRDTPPRVFCKKRLDFIENEGVRIFGNDKEFVIA
jgi:hypothetical protein